MRRSLTDESAYGGRPGSIRRRITLPFQKQSQEEAAREVHQGRYSVYNGLTWEKLKGFLESKFPQYIFNESRVGDHFVFETPEPLTPEDKREIEKLRDQIRTRRRSVTPE